MSDKDKSDEVDIKEVVEEIESSIEVNVLSKNTIICKCPYCFRLLITKLLPKCFKAEGD